MKRFGIRTNLVSIVLSFGLVSTVLLHGTARADERAALSNILAGEQVIDCVTATDNVSAGGHDELLHLAVGSDRSISKCLIAMGAVNLIFRKFASNEAIRLGIYADAVGIGLNIHFLLGEKHDTNASVHRQ